MPDYTKPNLMIPTLLWGEVKVAAFRCGKRPQELVIECLQEKYDDAFRQYKGLPSRASVQRLRDKVEALSGPVVETKPVMAPAVNVVTGSGKYGKPIVEEEPVATVTCFKCKEKVVKWTMDSRGKPWCDSCIQDQKNSIA